MKKKIIKILGIVTFITSIIAFTFSILSRLYDNELVENLRDAFFLVSCVLFVIVSNLRRKEEKLCRYIEEREKRDRDVFVEFNDDSSSTPNNNCNKNDE